MKNIALIPARSASKRLPGKNIKMMAGKPLIAHTIKYCKNVGLDDVYISTDSDEIAGLSIKYGAKVPFLRPDRIARDSSSDFDVIRHFIDELSLNDSQIIYYMRPTTLPKHSEIIKNVICKMNTGSFSGIRTISKINPKNHPFWAFKKDGLKITPFIDGVDLMKYHQSQSLPDCFSINGLVDCLIVENIKRFNNIYGNTIGYVEVDQKIFDIDDLNDFKACELFFQESRDEI